MKRTLLLTMVLFLVSLTGKAQIHKLAEMNAEQILNLNKEKTAVLIPGGILEEHGPYLPTFTDGYWNERLLPDLTKAIVAKPG